jgi:hypothetical protein
MFTITPMIRLQIQIEGEEPDTIAVATLIYEIFSAGNDTST